MAAEPIPEVHRECPISGLPWNQGIPIFSKSAHIHFSKDTIPKWFRSLEMELRHAEGPRNKDPEAPNYNAELRLIWYIFILEFYSEGAQSLALFRSTGVCCVRGPNPLVYLTRSPPISFDKLIGTTLERLLCDCPTRGLGPSEWSTVLMGSWIPHLPDETICDHFWSASVGLSRNEKPSLGGEQ